MEYVDLACIDYALVPSEVSLFRQAGNFAPLPTSSRLLARTLIHRRLMHTKACCQKGIVISRPLCSLPSLPSDAVVVIGVAVFDFLHRKPVAESCFYCRAVKLHPE